MLDQALDAAERGRSFPQLDLGGCGDGGGLPADDANRQHGAKTAHLAGGDRMAGMGRQAGIEHVPHARMIGEPTGELQGAVGLRLDAHFKRAQAT